MTLNEVLPEKAGGREICLWLCRVGRYALLCAAALVLVPSLLGVWGAEGLGVLWIAGVGAALFFLGTRPMGATADEYVLFSAACCPESRESLAWFSTLFFGKAMFAGAWLLLGTGAAYLTGVLWLGETGVGKLLFASLLLMLVCALDVVFSPFTLAYTLRDRKDLLEAEKLVRTALFAGFLWLVVTRTVMLSPMACGVALLISELVGDGIRVALCRYLRPDLWPRPKLFSLVYLRRILTGGTWYALYESGMFLLTAGVILFAYPAGVTQAGNVGLSLLLAAAVGMICHGIINVRGEMTGKRGRSWRSFVTAAVAAVSIGFADAFADLWLGGEWGDPVLTLLLLGPMVATAGAGGDFFEIACRGRGKKATLWLWLICAGLLAGLGAWVVFGPQIVMIPVAAMVFATLVWNAVCLPLLSMGKPSRGYLSKLLPTLRGYAGMALSLGLILGMQKVYTVDSWLKLGFMAVVMLPAVGGVCYICQYGLKVPSKARKNADAVDTGRFFLYNSSQG